MQHLGGVWNPDRVLQLEVVLGPKRLLGRGALERTTHKVRNCGYGEVLERYTLKVLE